MLRILHTFWDTGIRLRCPVCEQGALFKDWFTMHRTCPHCSVRFERHDGEETGGMSISIVVTAVIFLVGYYVSELTWDLPLWLDLSIWMTFAVVFPILFYRYSRALWVAFLHLTGDVHWDREPYNDTRPTIIDAFLNHPPDQSAFPKRDEPPKPPAPSASADGDDLSAHGQPAPQ